MIAFHALPAADVRACRRAGQMHTAPRRNAAFQRVRATPAAIV